MNVSFTGLDLKVLLVCDQPDLSSIWEVGLKNRGIQTFHASTPKEVLSSWVDILPDLFIIQIFGQSFGELELCRKLRGVSILPILLFGPRGDDGYLLEAYEAGVDECSHNSISPLLFLAKTEAWLRHTRMIPNAALEEIRWERICLNPVRREIRIGEGEAVKLTNLETRLLLLLINHPGRFVDSNALVERIWGPYGNGDNAVLKNVVYRLRKKIEADSSRPAFIHSQSGRGYKIDNTDRSSRLIEEKN
jgi:two-component system KDP operon response regulator KdpE